MPNFDSQQLYKDSCKLMTLAYEAQFCMTNADRIVYGNDFKQDTRRLQYIHYNPQRKCLQANPGYTFREMQYQKYNIRHSHHYDKTRKRARAAQA